MLQTHIDTLQGHAPVYSAEDDLIVYFQRGESEKVRFGRFEVPMDPPFDPLLEIVRFALEQGVRHHVDQPSQVHDAIQASYRMQDDELVNVIVHPDTDPLGLEVLTHSDVPLNTYILMPQSVCTIVRNLGSEYSAHVGETITRNRGRMTCTVRVPENSMGMFFTRPLQMFTLT